MKKTYQALEKILIDKLLNKDFATIERNQYTSTLRFFDGDYIVDLQLWIANDADCLRCYNDSFIKIDFPKELLEKIYQIARFDNGNIRLVEEDQLSNDLYFKVDGNTILTGYNDDYWWKNVSPKEFERLNIKRIDGCLWKFPITK